MLNFYLLMLNVTLLMWNVNLPSCALTRAAERTSPKRKSVVDVSFQFLVDAMLEIVFVYCFSEVTSTTRLRRSAALNRSPTSEMECLPSARLFLLPVRERGDKLNFDNVSQKRASLSHKEVGKKSCPIKRSAYLHVTFLGQRHVFFFVGHSRDRITGRFGTTTERNSRK